MRTPAHLADLAPGQSATIAAIEAQAGLRNRLEALGLRRGQRVEMLRRAWLAGPLHVRVGMTELMLRRADAAAALHDAHRLGLATEVARQYFLLRGLDTQRAVLDATIISRRETLAIHESKARAGLTDGLTTSQARTPSHCHQIRVA